jgi:hypothetical protein
VYPVYEAATAAAAAAALAAAAVPVAFVVVVVVAAAAPNPCGFIDTPNVDEPGIRLVGVAVEPVDEKTEGMGG